MTAVWAYSTNVPGKTCEDARLLGGGTNLQYPAGNDRGQAGWDIGLMFTGLGDLAFKLRDLCDKGLTITRIAINAHGAPGQIDDMGNGQSHDATTLINQKNSELTMINHMLAPELVVLFMGCNVASGDVGAKFLQDMSSEIFKKDKVVGFTTIGETMRQFRSGGYCSEAGMRDTPYMAHSGDSPNLKLQREKEVLTLPWASETSPHAKIALHGRIIFGAEPPTSATDYNPDSYLPGTWTAEIGTWKGYFVFARGGKMYWTDDASGRRHSGRWSGFDGAVQWSFDDDAEGWRRRFEVILPLASNASGNITVRGIPSGMFNIAKMN